MAKCGGWYYTKPPWHNDPMTAVTGESGYDTKALLKELVDNKNNDARILRAYLEKLHEGNERNPFGCAEPHAVYQLLKEGAELNQIFIGATFHTVFSEREREDVYKFHKPCENCRNWLTAQLKDGSYMIDMGELNNFVRSSRLKWWE